MTTSSATAPRIAVHTTLLALVATAALASSATDRKAPTTPTELRVTRVTAYSVSPVGLGVFSRSTRVFVRYSVEISNRAKMVLRA